MNLCNLRIYKPNFEKVRLGRNFDGGYVICKMNNYDCFISGGIGGDVSFEKAFLENYPDLTCYAFDGTVNFSSKPNFIFNKKNIGQNESNHETNLHDFLNKYKNIFIKMDIEGGEHTWINSVSDSQLQNIKQIVVEIHQLYDEKKWNILSRLAKTHWLVHLHGNNCGNNVTIKVDNIVVPKTIECTYIRKSEGPLQLNNLNILTNIDMRNDPHNPEIKLKGYPYQVIL